MGSEPKVKSKSNKVKILTGIVIILAIVFGLKWYLDYEERKELQQFYEAELQTAKVRLADISEELDQKIVEIERLGGDIEELTKAKMDLEEERDQLERTRQANRRLIVDLRNKTEGYTELLLAKDKEIERLTAVNEELLTENTDLKEETNKLNQSINELTETQENLEEKVEIASRLEAENIAIYAVNEKGREREGEFRQRHIDNLKIQFNIAKNEVAPIGGQNIMIRVIDENGQVYFDVAKGSGTFMIDNKEMFYTLNQEILFDNTNQQITFLYDKGSEYNRGNHSVEIYTDGYLMGKKSFTIK